MIRGEKCEHGRNRTQPFPAVVGSVGWKKGKRALKASSPSRIPRPTQFPSDGLWAGVELLLLITTWHQGSQGAADLHVVSLASSTVFRLGLRLSRPGAVPNRPNDCILHAPIAMRKPPPPPPPAAALLYVPTIESLVSFHAR
ncbi:hypothetical protein diail_8644 [Diaporthe ilicicola]|nr:hypothetical protein diail_8644 [Diaporthe ilicicola]